MKYLINAFLISFLYLNSIAYAIGEKKELSAMEQIAQYTVVEKLKQIQNDLQDLFRKYNNRRMSPIAMTRLFPLKDQPFIANQIRLAGTKSFPKMKKINNDYVVQLEGHTARANAIMLAKGYVLVNGKKYLIDPNKGIEEVFNDIGQLLTQKTSFMGLLFNDAQAVELITVFIVVGFIVAVTLFIGISLVSYIQSSLRNRLNKADQMNNAFARVKEIAAQCKDEDGRNNLVKNLKGGVNEGNAIVHHALHRSQDSWNLGISYWYDREELVEMFSKGESDNCDEYAEEIGFTVAEIIVNKANRQMKKERPSDVRGDDGEYTRSYLERAKKILKDHNCEENKIGLSKKRKMDVEDAKVMKDKIFACIKKSCDELVDKHENCLKKVYKEINYSDRKRNAKEAKGLMDWNKEIVIPKWVTPK